VFIERDLPFCVIRDRLNTIVVSVIAARCRVGDNNRE